ncbi:MAG: hypothetical protein ABI633_06555 [Burkholderiales bacterium]
MNQSQTRLDTRAADASSLALCADVFAVRKTHTGNVISIPVDAEQAKQAFDTHTDQAALWNPQPKPSDVLRTGAEAGRISAATLAAAHTIARFHANARAARTVQPLDAELGVGRAPLQRVIEVQTP